MANNYQPFAISISSLKKREHAWLVKFFEAMKDRPDESLDDDDSRADWRFFQKGKNLEMTNIIAAVGYDFDGQRTGMADVEMTEHYLHLSSGEGGDLELVAEFLHRFLKKFRPKQAVILSWAETCSSMRADEFGGGECLITADWVYWPPRPLGLMKAAYEKAKTAGKTLSPKQALNAGAKPKKVKR